MIEARFGPIGIASDLESFTCDYEYDGEKYTVTGKTLVNTPNGVLTHTLKNLHWSPRPDNKASEGFKRDWIVWSEANLVNTMIQAQKSFKSGRATDYHYA